MMGQQPRMESLFYYFRLEDQIPDDHLLRDSGSWSSNTGSGWQPIDKPQPKLQTEQQLRSKGAQRTQNFNSTRSFGGGRMRIGGGRRR